MKKLISILVVLCMLVSSMSAFAAAKYYRTGEAIPETGVLCFYDFESFTASDANNLAYTEQTNYKGEMYYANGFVNAADGNNYFRFNVDGNNFMYGLRDRSSTADDAKDYFDTGILKMEYDVLVPTPADTSKTNAVTFNTQNPKMTAGSDFARNYYNSVQSLADGAYIYFSPNKNNGGRPTSTYSNVVSEKLDYGKWYKITMIADYENNEVYQYLDGVLKTSHSMSDEVMTKYYGFNYGGLSQVGTPVNVSDRIRMDNILIERLAKADVEANVVNVGTNFVDVEFSEVVDSADITVETFSLAKLDGTADADAASVAKLSNYKYKVTFANNFAAASKYELVVNNDINEAGTPNKVAAGSKLLFNTTATNTGILAMDFNGGWSVDAPNGEAEAAEFTKYYYEAFDGTNDFAASSTLLNGHAGITSGGDGTSGDNWRVLSVTHKGNTLMADNTNTYQSIVFPFTGVQSVNSGIIEAEFEALIDPSSTGYFDVAFGLHDTKNLETTYSYDTTWADAAQFVGLTNATGNLKYLVPGIPESKGKVASKWSTKTESGKISPTWNDKYILASGITERVNTTPDYDKFKFIVDLDNDFFEVYFNGNKVYTSDYMPGRVNDGVYDAFVLTTNRGPSTAVCYVYFDNLKVTHRASALNLDSAAFEVGGKKVAYNENVDFGADEMTITMKENVGTVNKDLVKLSGTDDYTVSADGKVITLSFPNGLTNETDYTVTLDSSLASTTGATLGSDVVLSFATVTGEITYQTPVVDISNASLSAGDVVNVSVNAKKGIECSATIVIAAYKGTELADVATAIVADTDGVLDYQYTVSEKFAGADVVKVFVLNNLTDITPYAVNLTVGN